MRCKCGYEMNTLYRNHDDSYYDLFWCFSCGRVFELDEDNELWYEPEISKEIYEDIKNDTL